MKKITLFLLLFLPLITNAQTMSWKSSVSGSDYEVTLIGAMADQDKFIIVYNSSNHKEPEVLKHLADTTLNGINAVKVKRVNGDILYIFIDNNDPYHIKLLDQRSKFSMKMESPIFAIDSAYKQKYEKQKPVATSSLLDGNMLFTLFKAFLL